MAQIGEAIGVAVIAAAGKCPFVVADAAAIDPEDENISKDDLDSVTEIQDNDGGVLGRNLRDGSPGKSGTINELFPPPSASANPPVDTKRNDGGRLLVRDDSSVPYPYGVAAHHLIPGVAALANSRLHQKYMVKGGSVKTRSGRQYTVTENIGYNVNGAHNGVWLPGNYAIRAGTSPQQGSSWSSIVEDPSWQHWCFDYMLACVRKTKRQFHDAHPTYNENVLAALNRIHRALVVHQDACAECESKTQISPPYVLKSKLYVFSRYLRSKLAAIPTKKWKSPWYTSERFADAMRRAGILE